MPEWVEREQVEALKAWRAARDNSAAVASLDALRAAAQEGRNIMEPSIACAKAGVTTGEWAGALREVFGEYRAPTGVSRAAIGTGEGLAQVRGEVERVSAKLGRRLKFLVGKPGLDGHSNGAEQIAVRARDCGMEVVYEGIRLTPAQIVNAALEESVHVVGLSILSGSHVPLVRDIMERMRAAGLGAIPVVVGGIIPAEDEAILKECGVAAIYTPKNFQLNEIMRRHRETRRPRSRRRRLVASCTALIPLRPCDVPRRVRHSATSSLLLAKPSQLIEAEAALAVLSCVLSENRFTLCGRTPDFFHPEMPRRRPMRLAMTQKAATPSGFDRPQKNEARNRASQPRNTII